jgi:hypothetical protein
VGRAITPTLRPSEQVKAQIQFNVPTTLAPKPATARDGTNGTGKINVAIISGSAPGGTRRSRGWIRPVRVVR